MRVILTQLEALNFKTLKTLKLAKLLKSFKSLRQKIENNLKKKIQFTVYLPENIEKYVFYRKFNKTYLVLITRIYKF